MFGPISGATFKVAIDIAAQQEAKGITIVAMLVSHRIQYMAHPLWKSIKEEARQALTQPPICSSGILVCTPQQDVNKRLLISIHCRPAIT